MTLNNLKIGIIGLGYVGLPLAVEFGKRYFTVGFDLNLDYSHDIKDLAECNFYIIAVPTPLDKHKNPDLTLLEKASMAVSQI